MSKGTVSYRASRSCQRLDLWQCIDGYKRKIKCISCGKEEMIHNANRKNCYECDTRHKNRIKELKKK